MLSIQIKKAVKLIKLLSVVIYRQGIFYLSRKALAPFINHGFKDGVISLLRQLQFLIKAVSESATTDQAAYLAWIRKYEGAAELVGKKPEQFSYQPLISIVMPCYNPNIEFLEAAIMSVQAQLYSNWELCIADDDSSAAEVAESLRRHSERDSRIKLMFREDNGHISACSNSAIDMATGEFIALLDNDDVLHPQALFWVVNEINNSPDVCLIYTDEDKLDEFGRRSNPYFKSDFNYELFLAQNMVSHLGVYKSAAVRKLGGFRLGVEGAQDWDLALRIVETYGSASVKHIPRVLYHWRISPESTAGGLEAKSYAVNAQKEVVKAHLARMHPSENIGLSAGEFGLEVRYPEPVDSPLVSIIIPTKNAQKLVQVCIDSILLKTNYSNYEIIIVDNNSDDKKAINYFNTLATAYKNISIIKYPHSFNYSAINNRAAVHANGSYLLLLNNDIEIISPNWLGELLSIGVRDGVGCVGAKLYYPDDTVQHAGVIVGLGGVAGHIHKHIRRSEGGYFGRAGLRQEITAVTAACLLVKKEIYQEVGGLEEEHLAVAFNDVDFCLKVAQIGYKNIWTPYAECYHHESVSRGSDHTKKSLPRFTSEIEFMSKKWANILPCDPYFNVNCSLQSEQFSLAFPPR